jgi:hypothetical protein
MGDTKSYATSVVEVLCEHFPDLTDPDVARTAKDAIARQTLNPRDSFEFIVNDPWSARWRLKADSRDRRRVRLVYYPVSPPGSVAGNALEVIVNDALRALEADR